jgi:hypothetical protein
MKSMYGFILFGALFMVPSLGWSIAKEVKISSWTATSGTIVNLAFHADNSPIATVEYRDAGAVVHTVETSVSFGTEMKESVAVRYDPDAPAEAVVDRFFSKHLLTVILFPIGFIFSLVGFVVLKSTTPTESGQRPGS